MEILTAQVSWRRGVSGALEAGEPAYPLGPRFAGPRQGPGEGGSTPFDPLDARAPAGHGAHADTGPPRRPRFACERGRQVARIGGNLNHLGAVSGLVERRRRPH